MDSDTVSPTEPAWGTPPTEPAHWSRNKTLAAVGIAAVLAGVGTAVIYAADGGGERGGGGPGWGPPGGPGAGPDGFGASGDMSSALHGQFVVSDGHGGYRTELTQIGTVTDISGTAVTARSDDGFTQTYVIDTETRKSPQPIKAGDKATIRAVTQDGVNTAKTLSPDN
ncbi:MAG: hypothetical protein HYZ38_16715 [Mycobacterium sp.]|nr:hypothetical protein [Mycobacterium sp.]